MMRCVRTNGIGEVAVAQALTLAIGIRRHLMGRR
jgi:hypothetical protein